MFPGPQERRPIGGSRGLAAGISGTLHALAFVALVHAPAVKLPRPSESEYKQSIAGREEKIVWYRFHGELPKIAPPRAARENEPLRAETKASQPIISSAPNTPKRTRMVWTPAPQIRDAAPLESPNVVAVKLPPAPAKRFIEPPAKPPVDAVAKLASPAPALAARKLTAAQMPEAALAPKPFTAPTPAPPPQVAKKIVTPEAPAIAMSLARAPEKIDVTLAPRPFTAPPRHLEHTAAAPAQPADAPALLATNAPRSTTSITPVLGAKPFTAPPASRGATRAAPQSIPDQPAPPVLAANAKDLNLAMVGLNPIDRPLPPPSSTPADFSAGRQPRKNGADSQSSENGLAVPSLFVGKVPDKPKAGLMAQAFDAPTSDANLRAAMRSAPGPLPSDPAASQGEPTSHSGAVHVVDAPEPSFEGRDVFLMAIQMPNLTSYSGSWLMWYADRTRSEAGRAPISPPVPHRKVDPKYIASAVADRVEGKVRLACVITKDGTVSGVELLRGLDDRLNQSAEEALAKWEFYPATRKGEPVDVDVVVEIPFRLEPLAPKP